ncbi:MAG: hypothetical protein R3E82_19660 [Pseudomonadales bacterium]|nr:BatD family protein [Pseudomonadales bacterium]
MRWRVVAGVLSLAVLPVFTTQAAEVSVAQWIDPQRDIVARRQVDLYIEVATDGFFSGGTTIAEFEIPGVVVLRREQFAVNATRIKDGVSWAVQRWKIALYPQQSGFFEVPSIAVTVVSGPSAQRIEAATEPFGFSVHLPGELSASGDWVAVPRLEVEEGYDRPESEFEALEPGDAVVRVVEMSARDTVAMMLPEIRFPAPPGVAVYRDPPRLEDSVNRGVSRASRRETVTYVIEKAGRYALPQVDIHWWDTDRDEPGRHSLPARVLATSGFADKDRSVARAPEQDSGSDFWSDAVSMLSAVILTAVVPLLLILSGLGWLVRRRRESSRHPSLDQQLDQVVRSGRARELVALLYRWLDGRRSEVCTLRDFIATLQRPEIESARVVVMRAGFGRSDGEEETAEALPSSAAPGVVALAMRTLRRMTRQVPDAGSDAEARFPLN